MSLVILGTLAFDSIETPFGKRDKIVGGSGSYLAWSASLFSPVNLVSIVGGDFPKEELEAMAQRNVILTGVEINPDKKCFYWSGKYHLDMNSRDTLETQINVLENFNPIIPESYQDCTYLMLGNDAPRVQTSVIKQFKKRPKLIVLDTMNYWMDTVPDELEKTIALVDVLIINDSEARQLTKDYSILVAANKLLGKGLKFLVIKKGEHGAYLFHENNIFFAPALPLENVVDPTGAGDSFAGGFIGYINATDDISFNNLKKAVIYGSSVASFSIEKFGLERLKEINREDINQRFNIFRNIVHIN